MKEKDDDRESTSPNVIEMTACNDKVYNNPEDTKINMEPIVFSPNQKGYRLMLPIHAQMDLYGYIGAWRLWSCILLAHLIDQIDTSLVAPFHKTGIISKIAHRDHNYGKGKEFHKLGKYLTRRPRYWWKKVSLKDVCESYIKSTKFGGT